MMAAADVEREVERLRAVSRGLESARLDAEKLAEDLADHGEAVEASIAGLEAHECDDGPVDPPEPPPSGPLYQFEGWQSFPESARTVSGDGWPAMTEATVVCWAYPTRKFPARRPMGIAQLGDMDGVWLGEQRLHEQRPQSSTPEPHPIEGEPILVISEFKGSDLAPVAPPLQIGRIPLHEGVPTEFEGVIGRFKFFGRLLSDEEKLDLAEQGPPPGELPPLQEIEPPTPPAGKFPIWDPPNDLSLRDNGGRVGPIVRPVNGGLIIGQHFTNSRAAGRWPNAGAPAFIEHSDTDPNFTYTVRNCMFSKDPFGEGIATRYGGRYIDCHFDGVELPIVQNGNRYGASLYGRNLRFRNCGVSSPGELLWHHCGASGKYVGGNAVTTPSDVDLDGVLAFTTDGLIANAPWFWSDFARIKRLWNARFHGRCRTRGIMLEVGRGVDTGEPHLLNVECSGANVERAGTHPWSNVFNGALLIMNCGHVWARGLTIVTMPTPCSAVALQDDPARHYPDLPGMGGPTTVRDILIEDSLFVLRGPDSTLGRHYFGQPGLDGCGSNIKLRNSTVWVETPSKEQALMRCQWAYAQGLTVEAMTAAQIADGLSDLGKDLLL